VSPRTKIVAATISASLLLVACGSRVAPLSQGGLNPNQPGGFQNPTVNPTAVGTGGVNQPGGSNNRSPVPKLVIPGAQANCKPASTNTDVGVTPTSVKLGAVISITGPLPGQFDAARDAVASYFNTVNEQGGICGRRIEWTFKNDAGDTTNNRNRTLELVKNPDKRKNVFALVGSHSANDAGMAGVICPKGKPALGIPDIGFQLDWSHTECSTSFGVPGQIQRDTTGEGASGTRWLNQANGIKNIALFWVRESEVSILSAWGFEAADLLADPNLKVCYEQETSVFETNFTQYLFKLEDRCGDPNTTAVYTTMENNNNIRLAKAMVEQGYKPKVFAPTFTSYHGSFLFDDKGNPRPEVEGTYMAMPQIPFERCAERNRKPVPPCQHPELEAYVTAVNRFFPNSKRPGSFGGPAWGQAALLAAAIASCGSVLTRACVLNYLRTTGRFSANGFLTPTKPGTKLIYTADLIVQVRNGRFVEIPVPAGYTGPKEQPAFWNTSQIFNWWKFYCQNSGKRSGDPNRFLDTARKDSYIDCDPYI
jgi:ABC-type branched-subunit amino acid transport system substrate-binding protein